MANFTITEFTISAYEQVHRLWETCDGIGLSSADSRASIQKFLKRNSGLSFIFIFNDNTGGLEFWNRIGWTYRQDIGVVSKIIA